MCCKGIATKKKKCRNLWCVGFRIIDACFGGAYSRSQKARILVAVVELDLADIGLFGFGDEWHAVEGGGMAG